MKNNIIKLIFLLAAFLSFYGCGTAGDKEYYQASARLVIENNLSKNIIVKYKVFSGEIFSIWQGPNEQSFREQRVSDKEDIIPANESKKLYMADSQWTSGGSSTSYNKTITIRDHDGNIKEFNVESNICVPMFNKNVDASDSTKLVIDSTNFN